MAETSGDTPTSDAAIATNGSGEITLDAAAIETDAATPPNAAAADMSDVDPMSGAPRQEASQEASEEASEEAPQQASSEPSDAASKPTGEAADTQKALVLSDGVPTEEPEGAEDAAIVESSGFMKLRGKRIAYRETPGPDDGGGSPIILAHCSASHSGQWRALIAECAQSRRVFAPDFHGYGRSDPPPEGGAPAYLHDAAILAEAVAQEAEPAHLVGHGFGGLVAARVARDHPENVASLTLIEPAAFQILEETEDPRRLDLLEMTVAVAALVHFDESAAAARRFIDFWNGAGAFDALGPEPQAYVASAAGRISSDLLAANMHAPGQMLIDDFYSIRAPIHLISCSRSRPAARAVVARLRNALPHAHWTDIADAGHMTAATEPFRINPHVLRFIGALESDYAE